MQVEKLEAGREQAGEMQVKKLEAGRQQAGAVQMEMIGAGRKQTEEKQTEMIGAGGKQIGEMQMEKIEIRKMKISDYDEVYALWMSCTGMGLNNLDDSQEGIAKFLERNPDTCFVACSKERGIAGVILAGNDGRRGYIYHTAVHTDFRKLGIARSLVQRTLDALEACGIHKTALVVFDRNETGNQFWEKMGFTVRDDLVYRNKTITEMIRIDT